MTDFLCSLIEPLETQLTELMAAYLAVTKDGIKEYTLNTGQTIRKVTSADSGSMQRELTNLMNQHSELSIRCRTGDLSAVRQLISGW